MKQLPQTRVRPAPRWQTDRLARWLHEWTIERRLAEESEPIGRTGSFGNAPPPGRRAGLPGTSLARESYRDVVPPGVEPGQIRLLRPITPAAAARLWYVAVVQDEPSGGFVIAPFGRFAEPAFPGEWLTGRAEPNLRVLCLWNARVVGVDTIGASWLVSRLADAELADARAVWRSHHGETTMSDRLERQVGPPIVHPLDPRWNYRDEERACLEETLFPAQTDSAPSREVSFYERTEDAAAELALAAESGGTYAAVRFRVEGLPLALRIGPGPEPDQRTVLVVAADGQLSMALDGAVLQAPDGARSSPIRNGRVVVPLHLPSPGVAVVRTDGTRLPLTAEG